MLDLKTSSDQLLSEVHAKKSKTFEVIKRYLMLLQENWTTFPGTECFTKMFNMR